MNTPITSYVASAPIYFINNAKASLESGAQLPAYFTSRSATFPISSCEINFFKYGANFEHNFGAILPIIFHYLFSNSSSVSCINATASTMFTDTANNC